MRRANQATGVSISIIFREFQLRKSWRNSKRLSAGKEKAGVEIHTGLEIDYWTVTVTVMVLVVLPFVAKSVML